MIAITSNILPAPIVDARFEQIDSKPHLLLFDKSGTIVATYTESQFKNRLHQLEVREFVSLPFENAVVEKVKQALLIYLVYENYYRAKSIVELFKIYSKQGNQEGLEKAEFILSEYLSWAIRVEDVNIPKLINGISVSDYNSTKKGNVVQHNKSTINVISLLRKVPPTVKDALVTLAKKQFDKEGSAVRRNDFAGDIGKGFPRWMRDNGASELLEYIQPPSTPPITGYWQYIQAVNLEAVLTEFKPKSTEG